MKQMYRNNENKADKKDSYFSTESSDENRRFKRRGILCYLYGYVYEKSSSYRKVKRLQTFLNFCLLFDCFILSSVGTVMFETLGKRW